MKNTPPPISDAEALVMRELWARAPQGADEIAATLGPRQGWQLATVKTLLNRLLKKGAVTAERDGRRFLYAPAVPEDAFLTFGRLPTSRFDFFAVKP